MHPISVFQSTLFQIRNVNPRDCDEAAESMTPHGWQDFTEPQLFPRGELAALVHLSAPPKICCLRPNRDIGTEGSWAVRDSVNPDLSR